MNNLIDHFPKGKTPRPEQKELIDKVDLALKSEKKFIIINAATGIGKSFIAATLANSSNPACFGYRDYITSYRAFKQGNELEAQDYEANGSAVLTVTKNLQEQYIKDFDTDSKVFKGKTNYICDYDPDYDAEDAPCNSSYKLKLECWACNRCPYYEARNEALINKFGVYNYNVFMTLPDHVRKRDLIICDEASELENTLVDIFTFSITYEEIKKLLEHDVKKLNTEDEKAARSWLLQLQESFKNRVEFWEPHLENKMSKLHGKAKSMTKRLKRNIENIEKVFKNWAIDGSMSNSTEYVIELLAPDDWNRDVKEGVKFTPYKANKISRHLFNHGNKIILMSATMIDYKKVCFDLGINPDDCTYIEKGSSFDPKKSPIIISNKYALTYKTMKENLPKVIELVHKILDKHPNDKGLIHTNSFRITKALQDTLHDPRFIVREAGMTNEMLIEEHKRSDLPTVMISPSMSHGVDLKGDLGKFQIIMKVPYLALSDKRIKRLSSEDYRWYMNQALSSLVQMAGRCTRDETDEAITYIVDGGAATILQKNWKKLPIYFRERVI